MTMNTKVPFAVVGIFALTALAGCAKETKRAESDMSKTTPTVTETERPGQEAASDINPMTARLRVSDLKVGRALGADGAVAENVDELKPGEAVHASVAVGDVGAGSKIKAVWLGPDDKRIAEDVQEVSAGAAHIVFRSPDTKDWAGGDYKIEIYLGDELAASESFDIVLPAAA
jgi:hypothetical protein